MARARLAVQHFVACATIEPIRVAQEFAYRLSGVSYSYRIGSNREWPARLDSLWLFVRFFGGARTQYFDIDLAWLDGPAGEAEVCSFPDFRVQFGNGPAVASRAFPVSAARFPGPGRYEFQLRLAGSPRILARERILIRRA